MSIYEVSEVWAEGGSFVAEQSVRGITATYRMTNKQPPDRPSPFMLKILEPILLFDRSLDKRYRPEPSPV